MKKIPIEVSARHIHLTKEDFKVLFGEKAKLNVQKELSQPGMFAAEETVTVSYKEGLETEEREIKRVRIVGPLRDYTQLELSFSDAVRIGAKPRIRVSGDIGGTPGFKLGGPAGEIEKKEGMIVSQRHLHATPADLQELSLKDGEEICIRTGSGGKRRVVFCNVMVRASSDFKLYCHIDTDEGNAAGMLGWCGYGEIA